MVSVTSSNPGEKGSATAPRPGSSIQPFLRAGSSGRAEHGASCVSGAFWGLGCLQAGPASAARKVLYVWAGCGGVHQALCLHMQVNTHVHTYTCLEGWGRCPHLARPGQEGSCLCLQPPQGDGGAHVMVSVPCTLSALISYAEILAGTQRSHRAARRSLRAAKILWNLLPCVTPSQVSIGLRGSRC